MNALLISIPAVPLFAGVVVRAIGSKLRGAGAWLPFIATAYSVAALVLLSGKHVDAITRWFTVGSLSLDVGLRLDGLSWWVSLIVACVASAVNLYSINYMKEDDSQPRFFAWMSFFAGAMLTLVLASSLLLMFMAWEGVGAASWGLIGFWQREEKARYAAQEAFLMTRLGDFGFLLAWLTVLLTVRSVDILVFLSAVGSGVFPPAVLLLLALLFLGAAIGKSAQLPLSAWLPDAMAGPAPVSALMHSATMVAAGVYLILRLYPAFQASPTALTVILWVGAITAVVAALTATAQFDLKRILAWSTISQLGEMMIALGLGAPLASAFHLSTHAAFKSGLFLAAGVVDHAVHTRDLRELGGLANQLRLTAIVFSICALALAGFPLLSGFWSEESILEAAQQKGFAWGIVMVLLIFIAGVYISRAGVATFGWRPQRSKREVSATASLESTAMIVLAVAAAGLGLAIRSVLAPVLGIAGMANSESWGWRAAAIGASVTGLGVGTWRVLLHGPVPAFGRWPKQIDHSLTLLPHATAFVTRQAAALVGAAENLMDSTTKLGGRSVVFVARSASLAETLLDRASSAMVRLAVASADATERAETGFFARGAQSLADACARLGSELQATEAGEVYLYLAGAVSCVLAASVIFVWAAT